MSAMEDLWRRLEAWGKKTGAGSLKLRAPATEEEIRLAEGTMELAFPHDFREHLLWHDGQKRDPDFPWLTGCAPLQPLDAIVARWQEEREPARIPIAGSPSWSGPNTYLEVPSGRLITLGDGETVIVLGESLRAAVEKYVLQCERQP